MKKPFHLCTVHAATSIKDTNPAAGIGVSTPAASLLRPRAPETGRDLRGRGHPDVEGAGLHADALEPTRRPRYPAAAEELVVAVGGHRQPQHLSQDQQSDVVGSQQQNLGHVVKPPPTRPRLNSRHASFADAATGQGNHLRRGNFDRSGTADA